MPDPVPVPVPVPELLKLVLPTIFIVILTLVKSGLMINRICGLLYVALFDK